MHDRGLITKRTDESDAACVERMRARPRARAQAREGEGARNGGCRRENGVSLRLHAVHRIVSERAGHAGRGADTSHASVIALDLRPAWTIRDRAGSLDRTGCVVVGSYS
jgi:hypothetical protein